jgi:hypothetical protein
VELQCRRHPPPGGEQPRINLWIFNGAGPGEPAELIIKRFLFQPD